MTHTHTLKRRIANIFLLFQILLKLINKKYFFTKIHEDHLNIIFRITPERKGNFGETYSMLVKFAALTD